MRVNCREQIANPAEPVNGQDERRKCAAVDSPARLCCSVIKRATAQDAAALCHYSERGIFHDRTRKVSRTYPAYTRCLLQDCYSPRCHRRSPEHTELPLYQKQIQRFFELILDIDKAGVNPASKSCDTIISTSLTVPVTQRCFRFACSPRASSRWVAMLVRRCYMRIQWRI